jgi:hypothetical protein
MTGANVENVNRFRFLGPTASGGYTSSRRRLSADRPSPRLGERPPRLVHPNRCASRGTSLDGQALHTPSPLALWSARWYTGPRSGHTVAPPPWAGSSGGPACGCGAGHAPSLGPLARRTGVLLVFGWGRDGGAHAHPAWDQRLLRPPAPPGCGSRCSTPKRPVAKWAATVVYPPTVIQSLSRSRPLTPVSPRRNWAKSIALGKPRSAASGQRTAAGKACWSCWISARVVARKRPWGQGYG